MFRAAFISALAVLSAQAESPTTASSPTCALNGQPCPPPRWNGTWQLNHSTIVQPGGTQGLFIPPVSEPWGIVSLDWSVAEGLWLKANRNESVQETIAVANAQAIKAVSPNTRVFIYHNMELALQWQESHRAAMYDPSKRDYFLQYQPGNPSGIPAGTIYNEPRSEGDQFFWDFRNPEATAYYVATMVNTTSDPSIDGTFTDDVTGLPAEHDSAPTRMGLSAQDIQDIQNATQTASQMVIDALVAAGKYNWQAFGAQDGVGPSPTQANCASFMRSRCTQSFQGIAFTQTWDNKNLNQSLASFLITRGPLAWLGYGWESDQRNWQPLSNLDVGEPTGLCVESPTGVFSRPWTKGTPTLDCNTWTATLPFTY